MAKGKYKRKRLRQERKQIMIRDSDISTRVAHLLESAGIMTLADLDLYSLDKLAEISGVGDAAMQEIQQHRLVL